MVKPLPEVNSTGKLPFWSAVRVVAMAFVGLRGRSGHQQDFAKLKPIHVIVVGVLAALALVLTLIWVVNTVLAA